MTREDRSHAGELDRYWDALVLSGRAPASDLPDPETAAVIQQLWALSTPPHPEVARERVWQRLRQREEREEGDMDARTVAEITSLAPWRSARPTGWSASRLTATRDRAPWRGMLGQVATAALLVLVLAAGLVATGSLRPDGASHQPAGIPAVIVAPATPSPAQMPGEVVRETTNFGTAYGFPTTPAMIHLDRIELPPGASVSFPPDDLSLGAYTIASGTLTINMTEDVPVTRDGRPRGLVYGGEDTLLESGDGFVRKPNLGGEIRNDGTEPVEYLRITIVPETPEEPASDPGL